MIYSPPIKKITSDFFGRDSYLSRFTFKFLYSELYSTLSVREYFDGKWTLFYGIFFVEFIHIDLCTSGFLLFSICWFYCSADIVWHTQIPMEQYKGTLMFWHLISLDRYSPGTQVYMRFCFLVSSSFTRLCLLSASLHNIVITRKICFIRSRDWQLTWMPSRVWMRLERVRC